MANVGFKQEPVFYHFYDGVNIKIIKLNEDKYLWVQYTESDLELDTLPTSIYTKGKLKKMVFFFQSQGNLEALEMFEKFLTL